MFMLVLDVETSHLRVFLEEGSPTTAHMDWRRHVFLALCAVNNFLIPKMERRFKEPKCNNITMKCF